MNFSQTQGINHNHTDLLALTYNHSDMAAELYYGLSTMGWLFGAIGVVSALAGIYMKDVRLIVIGGIFLAVTVVTGYLGL